MSKNAFRESVLSKTRRYDWYKDFKKWSYSDRACASFQHHSMSNNGENIEKVNEMALENRHISLRKTGSELGIAYEKAQQEVLRMRRVASQDATRRNIERQLLEL